MHSRMFPAFMAAMCKGVSLSLFLSWVDIPQLTRNLMTSKLGNRLMLSSSKKLFDRTAEDEDKYPITNCKVPTDPVDNDKSNKCDDLNVDWLILYPHQLSNWPPHTDDDVNIADIDNNNGNQVQHIYKLVMRKAFISKVLLFSGQNEARVSF